MSDEIISTADLFAGIGGIRLGFEKAVESEEIDVKCVWANDKDKFCGETYRKNFGGGEFVLGDIKEINSSEIPDFDVLCAGFPCPTFSLAGKSKLKSLNRPHGLEDKTRGTLFREIVRILRERKPEAFFLENVKHLENHDGGKTFKIIRGALEEQGYSFYHKVINAKKLVPQNRERIYVVGFRNRNLNFTFPDIPDKNPQLKGILQDDVPEKYTLSDHLWKYLQDYKEKHRKKGHGFGYSIADLDGYSRTLSARYHKDGSEILIPQEGKNPRMLTPRECARLQGFPDWFEIPVSDTQAYQQFGNSVPVPVIELLAEEVIKTLVERPEREEPYRVQASLAESGNDDD